MREDMNDMAECLEEGYCGLQDLPTHYRVMEENGALMDTIHSSLPCARRAAADVIKGGGEAVILQSVEILVDRGASLDIRKPDPWL